jgi:uncharacterized protein YciI
MPGMDTRPVALIDDHLHFLDALHASKKVNMVGSRSYLLTVFPALTEGEAAAIVAYWMRTFFERRRSAPPVTRSTPEGATTSSIGVKPDALLDEHLAFLAELRASGRMAAFGARTQLVEAFPQLSQAEATAILGYWLETLAERRRSNDAPPHRRRADEQRSDEDGSHP